MKTGKLSENVYKRSVLKEMKSKRQEVLLGAGIGNDCAAFCVNEGDAITVSSRPVSFDSAEVAGLAMYAALNDVAASGADVIGVLVSGFLPVETEESELKAMSRAVEDCAKKTATAVLAMDLNVTDAANRMICTVTALGKVQKEHLLATRNAKPNQDIVLTKWIGLEGTALLAKEKREVLRKTLPETIVASAEAFADLRSILPEAATATKSGAVAMHPVSEGGIFGSLWELGESAGVGLKIDLKKLPVKQETIEVCEALEVNPYELDSAGALLIITDDGFGLVRSLEEAGISAAVIGRTMEGNDRILYNEDETRFLEPAHPDELYRAL